MSRLQGRLDRLARRLRPPPPAPRPGQLTPQQLDALSTAELLAKLEQGDKRWRASPQGRALRAALDGASDDELVKMWLQRPRSWSVHGGRGRS